MTAIKLAHCLDAQEAALADCLGTALKQLPTGSLPLRAGCSQGGLVDDSDITVTVLSVTHATDQVTARVGVFFSEIVGGCNCNEDPVAATAYCVLELALAHSDGRVTFTPLDA